METPSLFLKDPSAVTLVAGDLEAVFLPRYGMLGASLRHRHVEILRRVQDLEVAAAKGMSPARRDARRFGADACGHVALRRRRFSWGARHGRRGPRVTAVGAVTIGRN